MAKTKKKVFVKENIATPESLEIHYIKTNSYRSYHADGVFGGITPNKKLYMEFFIQRQATPRVVEYKLTPEGELGAELKRDSKKGLVREIEAGIVMDIEIAKVLKVWLDEKIKKFEEMVISLPAKDKVK